MTKPKKILAWHFLANDGTTRGNTRPEPGATETFDGTPILCECGLHGSIRAIDALQYAQGSIIRRVELSGVIVTGDDKLCATKRRELWRADFEAVLLNWARWCALQAQRKHWKDAPDVVKKWLRTGDPKLRADAYSAADAARAAARADAAAWAAADAAWAAADAARAAARADAAAWADADAARADADAAWAAAYAAWADADAAWADADAAWAAAYADARADADAAWADADAAARDAQNKKLESMLMKLAPKRRKP